MKRLPKTNKSSIITTSRWLAYATAGAATALGSANSAEAEIHYSGILNVKFDSSGGSFSTRTFELTGGANLIFARNSSFGIIFRDYVEISGAAVSAAIRTAYTFPPRDAKKLSFGQTVSSGRFSEYNGSVRDQMVLGYRSTSYGGYGQFKDRGRGFVGFKFDVGNGTQYGWARVYMGGKKQKHRFILRDYAFGDPGDTVTAGQISSSQKTNTVPDSGSLGLLAVGGAGLLAWRQRRKQSLAEVA